MSSKHIFNNPDNLVVKSLRGAVILNPSLRLHEPSKTVYLCEEVAARSKAEVLVIAGGGAGHEPASASYTGLGMLRSAVSGEIFASPSASQIRTAVYLALSVSSQSEDEMKDILLIVNNYTGDRLNFGLAAETLRSMKIKVATVTVADDVAVGRTPLGLVGRRGLAGYILVSKILGAAAERGMSLGEVESLGNAVVANLASIGLSLDHCHVPGKSKNKGDWEKLDEDACELGLGLHNERGVQRLDSIPEPKELVRIMLRPLLDPHDEERSYVNFTNARNEDIILFINNLGGLSQLEIGALVEEVYIQLSESNIRPCRVYCSSYMTSLNAPGYSISLLNATLAYSSWKEINREFNLPSIQELLDDPTDATAWLGARHHWSSRSNNNEGENLVKKLVGIRLDTEIQKENVIPDTEPQIMGKILQQAANSVINAEKELTHYDTVCGDGDCGATFAAGARAILKNLDTSSFLLMNSAATALKVAELCENNMGGTSGALFALFFTALSTALQSSIWQEACITALSELRKYTPARPGDRTLVDALEPFCEAASKGEPFSHAVKLARQGAERTKGMPPRLGRAVYLGTQSYNVPDPGAWGICAILDGILSVIDEED